MQQQSSKKQDSIDELLTTLQQVFSLGFISKGQQLKNQVIHRLSDITISQPELTKIHSLSLLPENINKPYLCIYIPKQPPHSSQQLKKLVIASALFPFDLTEFFRNQTIFDNKKRLAIQLFYSLAYGHPCAAIELRSFIGQYTQYQSVCKHKLRELVLAQQCDFSPKLHCSIFHLYLDQQLINKYKGRVKNQQTIHSLDHSIWEYNMGRKYYMRIQEDDEYVDRFQEQGRILQMYDEILGEVVGAGLVQIKIREIVVYEKYYEMRKVQDI